MKEMDMTDVLEMRSTATIKVKIPSPLHDYLFWMLQRGKVIPEGFFAKQGYLGKARVFTRTRPDPKAKVAEFTLVTIGDDVGDGE